MAAEGTQLLSWRDGRLGPVEGSAPLLVADSFLLNRGSVVALDGHRERFLRSVASSQLAAIAQIPVPVAEVNAFWSAAVAALPRDGRWFPRLELVRGPDGAEYRLTVRPAPPLGRLVTLLTWDGADPRRAPTVKGPDLEALLGIRASAIERGADEAVLLSGGAVSDATTSSIAWWRDGTLCLPADELPRVGGITERCVAAVADRAGVAVVRERRRPEELEGREVWVLNALH